MGEPTVQLQRTILKGTVSYDNWHASGVGEPHVTYEYLLYSDASFNGEIAEGLGPYQFLNLCPLGEAKPGYARPAVVLRAGFHIRAASPPETEERKQRQARYHGGDIIDEVVALASLRTGARLKCGPKVRRFYPGDKQGRPLMESLRPEPYIPLKPLIRLRLLPYTASQHSLMSLHDMVLYPKLNPEDSIALVRAARLYQESLWVAESEPNLSWLWLVSAIETVANRWRSTQKPSLELCRTSRPDLFCYLDGLKVGGLATRVAKELAPLLGPTMKFISFLRTYHPDPPPVRPKKYGQVKWSKASLDDASSKIYDWRSRALHDGTPFPLTMCEPPLPDDNSGAFLEKPFGESDDWKKEDTPMLLHTFEYIVRHSLLKWWKGQADDQRMPV